MQLISFEISSVALAIFLSSAFSLLAYKKRWLSGSGALASSVLGGIIWASGSWQAALPMVVFFLSGSLLGKLPRKAVHDAKHARPRDWVQVMANGGIACLALLAQWWSPSEYWPKLYLVSLAISAADTWSSEIGQWAGGRVVDIVGLRPLPAGISGGVSLQGTAAGWMGAVLVALAGLPLVGADWSLISRVVVLGFMGMLADSLLGSLCQARYRLPGGTLTENPDTGLWMKPEKGWSWMTNDTVNWISNLLLTALAFWWLS